MSACGVPEPHGPHLFKDWRGKRHECDGEQVAYAEAFDPEDLQHEAEHGGYRPDEYDPAASGDLGSWWDREALH